MGIELDLRNTRLLLHRAIQELSMIHEIYREAANHKRWDLIESREGKEIVKQGMDLLGLDDLSDDSIVGKQPEARS